MPFVMGISGGSGSGKTTLARKLVAHFASIGVVLIDQDSYYRDCSHVTRAERDQINFDEPRAVDFDLFAADLERLARGEPITKPRYSFLEHVRTGEFDRIEPAPLVIVEGLFAFWDPRARELMGLTVFLTATEEERFARRLHRDLTERGRTEAAVREQFIRTVRPMHLSYVEPMRSIAHLVLDTTAMPVETSLFEILAAVKRACPSFAIPG